MTGKTLFLFLALIGAAIVFAIGMVIYQSRQPIPLSKKPLTGNDITAVASVSAKDLMTSYRDNEIAADQAYKGKVIEISGTVIDISTSAGQPYILVGEDEHAVFGAKCFLPGSDHYCMQGLSAQHKGYPITIKGRVVGKLLANIEVRPASLDIGCEWPNY